MSQSTKPSPTSSTPFTRLQTSLKSLTKFLSFVHANTSLPTILALSSLLQLSLLLVLSRYVAALPGVLYLIHKLITANPSPNQNSLLSVSHPGKWISQIPSPTTGQISDTNGDGGIVCFILGAQVNHPLGLLAPGFKEMGEYFDQTWRDAAAEAETSGYLHHTRMLQQDPEEGGRITCTISYWRSLEQLQRFVAKGAHRDAMKWWNKEKALYPHLGICHETFVCRERSWENVYENMGDFGMMGVKGGLKGVEGKKGMLSWRMGRE